MKENKIEKLILDLSNCWECTPQEAVDRLNSMNESEINKLINSMTKKFQVGGRAFGPKIPYGNYMIMGTKTEVLPKKSEVTQSQIDSAYNAEQDAFRKRAEQLIPELEQRNAETKQRLGNNQNWQTIKANSPVQMPVTNSDPQYFNGLRNFKFKNGGFINCLRAGGTIPECKKCGGKAPIKADNGNKLPYYMTSKVERVFGGLSQNPKYPREDGIDGHFSGEILPSGDTVTVVEGPYTKYEEVRPADGNGRFFNVYRKDNSDRFYDPGRKDRGWFRTKASEELVEMFNNIRSRFEGSTDKKKCGGPLPSKKKDYLKK